MNPCRTRPVACLSCERAGALAGFRGPAASRAMPHETCPLAEPLQFPPLAPCFGSRSGHGLQPFRAGSSSPSEDVAGFLPSSRRDPSRWLLSQPCWWPGLIRGRRTWPSRLCRVCSWLASLAYRNDLSKTPLSRVPVKKFSQNRRGIPQFSFRLWNGLIHPVTAPDSTPDNAPDKHRNLTEIAPAPHRATPD